MHMQTTSNNMTRILILSPFTGVCSRNCVRQTPSKHHAMVLGFTDHQFSFTTKDSLDLLGMTIDSQLNFDNQVSLTCKKVNNQLNVMIRFRELLNTSTTLKLYKAFVLPHFMYCSVVWHFCSSRNSEELESLNKRALHACGF